MAPARTEVTGLFAPWLGPHCSEDATKARENGVARFFAARRIRGSSSLSEKRKDVSVTVEERGVALVDDSFFRDGESLPW
jgi:hypothetical protein